MYKMIGLSLILLFIFSCKPQKEKELDVSQIIGSKWDGKNRKLNKSEIEVAKNICKAISYNKDKIRRMGRTSLSYRFEIYKLECQGRVQKLTDVLANLTEPVLLDGPPKYTTSSKREFSTDIFTDENRFFKNICKNINLPNQKLNVVENVESYKVKFHLYQQSTLEMAVYSKDSKGEWRGRSFENISIYLNDSNNRRGMAATRYSGNFCPSGNGEVNYIYQKMK